MNTGKYTCLEILARPLRDGQGIVRLTGREQEGQEQRFQGKYYRHLKFFVEQEREYEIHLENCQVSLCYLSGREDIFEAGVRYLEQNRETGVFEEVRIAEQYDSPIREQYHFGPWKNWINDPNGLCWFKGYYHLFYQFNPHGQEWSSMYWGHAASKDLLHWTHLPIVLGPQEEILRDPENLKGGAFSGCEITQGDTAVFYLTRHLGPWEDCEDTVQRQWRMTSEDMLNFSKEELVIGERPKEASFDFRDPKVIQEGDKWYMVLASAVEGKGAILLYRSEDMVNWTYLGPLLKEEKEDGVRCFECPDFMKLDQKYLALGALMCHEDREGRYQMSKYYIGSFEEERFTVESEGWFDFGSNCYAMQSFEHEGRRINIGWISDFYGEHVKVENGAYGSMTLPREMRIRNQKLYLTPVEEVKALEGETLYEGCGEEIGLEEIAGGAYKASLSFSKDIDFSILLGKDGEKEILFLKDREGARIETKGVKTQGIRFKARVDEIRSLEIYGDRRTMEIYINDGEAVGTKLFYNQSGRGTFILKTDRPREIEKARVCKMKSIWNR